MNSPYRDSLEAQRDRLKSIESQIHDIEESLSDFFWESVARTLPLPEPVEAADPASYSDQTELGRALADREERLFALQRTQNALPRLEQSWRTPAEDVPPLVPPFRIDLRASVTRAIAGDPHLPLFVKSLSRLSPETDILKDRENAYRASLMSDGVPFQVMCESYMGQHHGGDWQVELTVQTTVSHLAEELQLSPQGFGNELLIALRLKQDIKIGNAEFDGYFVVRGAKAAAEAMLTSEVREGLMTIAREDIPQLVVARGLAILRWSYEPNLHCLEAAFAALRGVRAAPPTRSLSKA